MNEIENINIAYENPFFTELGYEDDVVYLLSLLDERHSISKWAAAANIEDALDNLTYEQGKDLLVLLSYLSNIENFPVIRYLFPTLYPGTFETISFICKVYASNEKTFYVLDDVDVEKNNRLLIDDIESRDWLSPHDFIYLLSEIEEKLKNEKNKYN